MDDADSGAAHKGRALWLSTVAFTICFAVWTIFSIIGIEIKQELGLNDTEFGLLVGTPILSGSLIRLVLGIWTDQYGGRRVYTIVMLAAAVATYLLTWAKTYPQFLVAALFVGIAGGSFAVGVAYVSRFCSTARQGTALGIFGAGNVGAALTKFLAPFVLVAYGWQAVAQAWALVLGVMAVIFWISCSSHRCCSGACPIWHSRVRSTCFSAAARNAALRVRSSACASSIAVTNRTTSGVTTRIASVRPCR